MMSLTLMLTLKADASTRPRYGGTVRVLLQHKITTIDPAADSEYPAERDRLSSLVFETLTEIDPQGHIRPRLASSWQAETGQRIWQFQLRAANFHDGTAVTSSIVAANLKSANPEWKVTANGRQSVTIEMPFAAPHLLELLSLQRFAIVKR